MLGGLAAFVGDNFAAATALQPARGESKMTLADEVLAAIGAVASSKLKDVQLSGTLGEEDAAVAVAMEQVRVRVRVRVRVIIRVRVMIRVRVRVRVS